MTTWILIIIMSSHSYSIEFNSKETCEAAKKAVVMPYAVTIGRCVQK